MAELRPQSLLLVPIGRLGAAVDLPAGYVTEYHGRLQHGYAITTAVAQGSSVQQAFVLGSDATYREAGYTAASRARERTQFYVVFSGRTEIDEERHGGLQVSAEEQDPLQEFVEALGRSRTQSLAIDTGPGAEPTYAGLSQVRREDSVEERLLLSQRLQGAPRDRRAQLARVQLELAEAQARSNVLVPAEDGSRAPARWRFGTRQSTVPVQAATAPQEEWLRRAEALSQSLERLRAEQQLRVAWETAHRSELARLVEINRLLALDRAPAREEPVELEVG